MQKTFFDDFKAVSKSEQQEKTKADLGNNHLLWETLEGIGLQSIYHKEVV